MIIYVYYLSILIFFSIMEIGNQKQKNSNFINTFVYWFLILLIIIFAGFHDFGRDYNIYHEIYLYIINYDSLTIENMFLHSNRFQIDLSFVGISKMINLVTSEFQFLYLFYVSCGIILVALFTRRYSKYSIYSIFLFSPFIFTYNMGGIRQSVAIGLLLYVFAYSYENRNKLKYFFILLASFFHISSIIFIIMNFFFRIKLNRNNILLLIFFSVILFYIFPLISTHLISFLPKDLFFTRKITRYLEEETLVRNFFNINMLYKAIIIYYGYKYFKHQKTTIYTFFFRIYFLSFLIYLIFPFEIMANRISDYGRILEIVLIPYLLTHSYSRYKLVLFLLMPIFYTFGKVFLMLYRYQEQWEYTNYLFK